MKSKYLDGRPWEDVNTHKRYTSNAIEFVKSHLDIVKDKIQERIEYYKNEIRKGWVDKTPLNAKIGELAYLMQFIKSLPTE